MLEPIHLSKTAKGRIFVDILCLIVIMSLVKNEFFDGFRELKNQKFI